MCRVCGGGGVCVCLLYNILMLKMPKKQCLNANNQELTETLNPATYINKY